MLSILDLIPNIERSTLPTSPLFTAGNPGVGNQHPNLPILYGIFKSFKCHKNKVRLRFSETSFEIFEIMPPKRLHGYWTAVEWFRVGKALFCTAWSPRLAIFRDVVDIFLLFRSHSCRLCQLYVVKKRCGKPLSWILVFICKFPCVIITIITKGLSNHHNSMTTYLPIESPSAHNNTLVYRTAHRARPHTTETANWYKSPCLSWLWPLSTVIKRSTYVHKFSICKHDERFNKSLVNFITRNRRNVHDVHNLA